MYRRWDKSVDQTYVQCAREVNRIIVIRLIVTCTRRRTTQLDHQAARIPHIAIACHHQVRTWAGGTSYRDSIQYTCASYMASDGKAIGGTRADDRAIVDERKVAIQMCVDRADTVDLSTTGNQQAFRRDDATSVSAIA